MSEPSTQILDEERLAALYSTKLLATQAEESFDRVTRLVAKLLRAPVALISLIDADHQYFKSCVGLPEPLATERRTPLSHSFCKYVVDSGNLLAVSDARQHPVLCKNLATTEMGVIAYLGVPLKTHNGLTIGSLCAIDSKPVDWTDEQKDILFDLAAFVVTEIEARQSTVVAQETKLLISAMQHESRLEQSFRSLADAMPQIVWTSSKEGYVRYFNKRWFDYTGMTFEQTKDRGWVAVMHPDDLDRCLANVAASRQSGKPHVGEYRLRNHSDGQFRWHLSRSLPRRDENGDIIEWVGTSTDIHDYKLAQTAVEQSRDALEQSVAQRTEQLLRGHRFIEAVLQNVSDGIYACDRQGHITYINPAFRKMVGLEQIPDDGLTAEWATQNIRLYDPVTQELVPWNQRPLARAIRGEPVESVELLTDPGTGEYRTIVVTVRAMTDQSGEIIGAVAASHDITEQRRTQEELLTSRRIADAANQAKSDFLANMSHEIRTPLSAIIGFSDLQLRKENDAARQDEYIQIVRRNAKHLLDLINDILDLSKIEAGQMVVEKIDCDLPMLLAEIISTMRPRASERELTFDITFEGLIPRTVQTDSLRLRQILINLLGNAIKFTEKGSVHSKVYFRNNTLYIDIKDSGIGLSPQQLEKLFQSFTQADESTTRKFGGTGLGLTISRRLARLLGGDITVKSAEGIGSLFSLSFDCGSPRDMELLTDLREAGHTFDAGPSIKPAPVLRGRILLAEDGRDNQRLLTTILRASGAEVVVAENGLVAVNKIEAQQFDLVLMDMQMPKMDGYAATTELRRRGHTLPIIALTAHAMAEDRAKCIASGCSDYLSKPVNVERLIQTVAHYLEQTMPVSSSDHQVKPNDSIRSTMRDYPGFSKIIDDYIADLPQTVNQLLSLIDDQDLHSLRRLVHQIKGSGGGYGFDLITEAAAQAESTIDQAADAKSIVHKIDSLVEVIRRVEGFETSPLNSMQENS